MRGGVQVKIIDYVVVGYLVSNFTPVLAITVVIACGKEIVFSKNIPAYHLEAACRHMLGPDSKMVYSPDPMMH